MHRLIGFLLLIPDALLILLAIALITSNRPFADVLSGLFVILCAWAIIN